jgi:2-phosphosulfolactate phosphatase
VQIRRLSLQQGALSARGTTVIIDVFRAFTCEPLMYQLGAERILLEHRSSIDNLGEIRT